MASSEYVSSRPFLAVRLAEHQSYPLYELSKLTAALGVLLRGLECVYFCGGCRTKIMQQRLGEYHVLILIICITSLLNQKVMIRRMIYATIPPSTDKSGKYHFLIQLQNGIPWHERVGYTTQKLNLNDILTSDN
jgi:hypothetical protein